MANLELRPHPARRKNEITGEMVPAIEDLQSIWLDGQLIGYCGAVPARPITLIRHFHKPERAAIFEWAASEGVKPSTIVCPPPAPVAPTERRIWTPDDEDDND